MCQQGYNSYNDDFNSDTEIYIPNPFYVPPYNSPFPYLIADYSNVARMTNIGSGANSFDFTWSNIPAGADLLLLRFFMYQDLGNPRYQPFDNTKYVTLTFDTAPGYSVVLFNGDINDNGSFYTQTGTRYGVFGVLGANNTDRGYNDYLSGGVRVGPAFLRSPRPPAPWFDGSTSITATFTFSDAVDQSNVNPVNTITSLPAGAIDIVLGVAVGALGGDPHVKLSSGERFDFMEKGVFRLFSNDHFQVHGHFTGLFVDEIGIVCPSGRIHLGYDENEAFLKINDVQIPLDSQGENWKFIRFPQSQRNDWDLGGFLESIFSVRHSGVMLQFAGGKIVVGSRTITFFDVREIRFLAANQDQPRQQHHLGLLQLESIPEQKREGESPFEFLRVSHLFE